MPITDKQLRLYAVKFDWGRTHWRCVEAPDDQGAGMAVRSEYKNAEVLCTYPLDGEDKFRHCAEYFGLPSDLIIDGVDRYPDHATFWGEW